MTEIIANPAEVMSLGKMGENLARKIIFSLDGFPSPKKGTATLLIQRAGEDTPYPAEIEQKPAKVIWFPTSLDTEKPGKGMAELQWRVGEKLVKSCIFSTLTLESLGPADPDPPDPATPWIDKVVAAGESAKKSASDAAESRAAAEDAARRAEAAAGQVKIGNGLKWSGDTLEVDTADKVEADNSLPITSAAVHVELGNVEALLAAL